MSDSEEDYPTNTKNQPSLINVENITAVSKLQLEDRLALSLTNREDKDMPDYHGEQSINDSNFQPSLNSTNGEENDVFDHSQEPIIYLGLQHSLSSTIREDKDMADYHDQQPINDLNFQPLLNSTNGEGNNLPKIHRPVASSKADDHCNLEVHSTTNDEEANKDCGKQKMVQLSKQDNEGKHTTNTDAEEADKKDGGKRKTVQLSEQGNEGRHTTNANAEEANKKDGGKRKTVQLSKQGNGRHTTNADAEEANKKDGGKRKMVQLSKQVREGRPATYADVANKKDIGKGKLFQLPRQKKKGGEGYLSFQSSLNSTNGEGKGKLNHDQQSINDLGFQDSLSSTIEENTDTPDYHDQEPMNDSGFNESSNIIDTNAKSYKKPLRPCYFCKQPQSRLKRHILTRHKNLPEVQYILELNEEEQDEAVMVLRRKAIRDFNLEMVRKDGCNFMRERNASVGETPYMCSGCKGFFSKSYGLRHQKVCSAIGVKLVLPVVSILDGKYIEAFSDGFKVLLNTLRNDDIGSYIKTDSIILVIGERSFAALRRKKDKIVQCQRTVRSRMRIMARLYLNFIKKYNDQSNVILNNMHSNAADMYRRETITILGQAVEDICEKEEHTEDGVSLSDQKSGLKVSILNFLKLSSKFLIGHFLVKNCDGEAENVRRFLEVLKLFENDFFGDAFYDLNYRKNVHLRKPVKLPKDDDIQMLINECHHIFNSANDWDHPSHNFVELRAAAVTVLTIFNARRGGEPARLQRYQWKEAVQGDWNEQDALPEDDYEDTMLITFQTGKGANHLVPVIFPSETIKPMQMLCNDEFRLQADVNPENKYCFPSTQKSLSHTDGWQCINFILSRISKKGALNATTNRHRVASILAKLQLTDGERDLIYKHFGHSERINATVYQAPAGASHVALAAEHLSKIHRPNASSEADDHCNLEVHSTTNAEKANQKDSEKQKMAQLSKQGREGRHTTHADEANKDSEKRKMVQLSKQDKEGRHTTNAGAEEANKKYSGKRKMIQLKQSKEGRHTTNTEEANKMGSGKGKIDQLFKQSGEGRQKRQKKGILIKGYWGFFPWVWLVDVVGGVGLAGENPHENKIICNLAKNLEEIQV